MTQPFGGPVDLLRINQLRRHVGRWIKIEYRDGSEETHHIRRIDASAEHIYLCRADKNEVARWKLSTLGIGVPSDASGSVKGYRLLNPINPHVSTGTTMRAW